MISLSPAHLNKYKDIAWLLWKYGRSDLVKQAGLHESLADEDQASNDGSAGPEDLAHDLEQLGPTFVKFGQVLSTRADLLPQPYLDALSRLQDDVEPVSFERVEQVIEQELNASISDLFAHFEREPAASASLGQVHRATLHDGTKVAVKVQRPEIGAQVRNDLKTLAELAEMFDTHTSIGKTYRFEMIVDSLRRRMIDELDYEAEAENCRQLSDNLSECEAIVVPRIHMSMTTSRVLTMDYLEGAKVTEFSEQRPLPHGGPGLANALFRAYLQQVLADGLFHADPHPGNLLVLTDGRIGLMDFGMVVRVPRKLQQQLAKILINISEGRGEETARETVAVSHAGEDADKEEFIKRIARLVAEHHNRPINQLAAGEIVLEIQRIAGECGLTLPDELRMLGKTLLHLDEIVALLDPDFDPGAAIREHTTGIIEGRLTETLSLSRLYESMIESAELTQAAPERLNRFTQLLADNELRVNVDAIDQTKLMKSLHKIANRITTGLILAALIVGASLMMRMSTSFTILGYPGIAMLFFLTAAIAGLVLVYRMTFHDHAEC